MVPVATGYRTTANFEPWIVNDIRWQVYQVWAMVIQCVYIYMFLMSLLNREKRVDGMMFPTPFLALKPGRESSVINPTTFKTRSFHTKSNFFSAWFTGATVVKMSELFYGRFTWQSDWCLHCHNPKIIPAFHLRHKTFVRSRESGYACVTSIP